MVVISEKYSFAIISNGYLMSMSLGFVPCFPSTSAIMCPDIVDPMNGQIDFSPDAQAPFDFGTLATYSCDNPGWRPNGGDVLRTCEGDSSSPIGSWSGTAPNCVGMF